MVICIGHWAMIEVEMAEDSSVIQSIINDLKVWMLLDGLRTAFVFCSRAPFSKL